MNSSKILIVSSIIILFLFFDLWSKKWAQNSLTASKQMFGGKIKLIYTKNYGVAFGILSGKKKFILIINILLFLYLGYLVFSNQSNYIGYVFILTGGLGNFLGRLKKGYVIDFIYFNIKFFPVFNIADFEIFLGILILLL